MEESDGINYDWLTIIDPETRKKRKETNRERKNRISRERRAGKKRGGDSPDEETAMEGIEVAQDEVHEEERVRQGRGCRHRGEGGGFQAEGPAVRVEATGRDGLRPP